MLILYLILSLVVVTHSQSQTLLCNETNNNLVIEDATRLEDRLFILATTNAGIRKLYRLDGFTYSSNSSRIDFIQTSHVKGIPDWINETVFLFTVDNYQKTLLLVLMRYHMKTPLTVKEWTGYTMVFDSNYDILEWKEMPMDIYGTNLIPKETDKWNQWNLKSLFDKFPPINIDTRMTAILTFPLKNKSIPKRFFVYYMDQSHERQTLGTDKLRHDFRRHIMEESFDARNSEQIFEFGWKHDVYSGKCVKQNYVSAATALDEYHQINESKSNIRYFDLIEFADQRYTIKRVFLNGSIVRKNLQQLAEGSVNQLLKCEATESDTTTQTTTTQTTTPNISNAKTLSIIQFWLFFISLWLSYL